MGNQFAIAAPSVVGSSDLPTLLGEHLPNQFTNRATLGTGKLLKTVQCLHESGLLCVIKLHLRRDGVPTAPYEQRLLALADALSSVPAVLVQHKIDSRESADKCLFVARQYITYNLNDRFHTHPYLTNMEKRWLTYQLLYVVSAMHACGVRHGDLKCENLLLTSWSFILITDIAFYKPTFMPANNPYEYSLFFEGQRRRCYLAPERFYVTRGEGATAAIAATMASGTGHIDGAAVTEAMDMFSVGCCISEIWLEGEALFDLPQLLAYREGAFDPIPVLQAKITDDNVRALIVNCIAIDPAHRSSARALLSSYSSTVFPQSFPFIYKTFAKMMEKEFQSPDAKVSLIHSHQNVILKEVAGLTSNTTTPLSTPILRHHRRLQRDTAQEQSSAANSASGGENGHRSHPTALLTELKSFTSRLSSFDSDPRHRHVTEPTSNAASGAVRKSSDDADLASGEAVTGGADDARDTMVLDANALTLIINVLCAAVQNVRYPLSKLTILDLFLFLSPFVDDEIKLGRIVPYCVSMLTDVMPIVRAGAVETMTRILTRVQTLSPADAHIFPEYILPALSRLPTDSEELVRLSYAQSIAALAETSKRFLDLTRALTTDGAAIAETSYDADLSTLTDMILKVVIDMLTLGGSRVTRAVLSDMSRLCIFMGRKRVNNDLLPHLITVLNDRDWQLRLTFFTNITSVSVFVGQTAFLNFVLPCIEQVLFDKSEFVIQRALQALSALCKLRLFDQRNLLSIMSKVRPLIVHPSAWIRHECIHLIVAMATVMGDAQAHCFLLPIFQPMMRANSDRLVLIDRDSLSSALKPPLTRAEYRSAIRAELSANASTSDTAAAMVVSDADNADTVGGTDVSPSGLLSDATVAPIIIAYLKRVAAKSQTIDADDNALSADGGDDYHSLEEEVPLYGLEVERTAYNDVTASGLVSAAVGSGGGGGSNTVSVGGGGVVNGSAVAAVQRDLYESLGVHLDGRRIALSSAAAGAARRAPIVRQSASAVNDYILKALHIPPPPPALGTLRETTVTWASTYRNHRGFVDGFTDAAEPRNWRPRGVLVSSLNEHKLTVNALSVSRDNLFIVSGGDDGAVKVWDVNRFKLTALGRSQLTYQLPSPGRVTSLTVCDSSHAVAVGSDSGAVHIFKVEYSHAGDDAAHRYVGLSAVKQLDDADGDAVVSVEHWNTLTESLLVYASRRGRINGWDIRAKREPFSLFIPPELGTVTAMTIGPSAYCLSVGTSRGFLQTFDLRFHLPIHTTRHSAARAIAHLYATTIAHSPTLFVSAEFASAISAFDLSSGQCKVHVSTAASASSVSAQRTATLPALISYSHIRGVAGGPPTIYDESFAADVAALTAPTSASSAQQNTVTAVIVCPQSFILTASTDRTVRYFDTASVIDSYHVVTAPSPAAYRYTARTDTASGAVHYEESIIESNGGTATAAATMSAPTAHSGAITALCAMEFPSKMFATASRDGTVKVFI